MGEVRMNDVRPLLAYQPTEINDRPNDRSDARDSPTNWPEHDRRERKAGCEVTGVRKDRDDMALGGRAPADELDQLMLGTATIKASDQVKNTRMIHPEGFGVRRSWMESRAPGPNGIGRPSRKSPGSPTARGEPGAQTAELSPRKPSLAGLGRSSTIPDCLASIAASSRE